MPEELDTGADPQVDATAHATTGIGRSKEVDAPSATEATSAAAAAEKKASDTEEVQAEPKSETDEAAASEKDADAKAHTQDTEMKDAAAADEAAGAAPNGVPATPATGRKTGSSGSSKKKSSGVPEHRVKKLNRKKSKADLHLDCKPGELYLARMKGHPAWPSVVCDEEMLPSQLLNNRPVTTALPDGTFKKPEYANGGKRAHERTFPVMFLHTNEFAWMPNTDLTAITPDECKDVPEKGKTKALLEAYGVAAEDHDLKHWKEMLRKHQEAVNEDLELQKERQAKKASKAERQRRKSEAVDEDEMEVDGEEEEKPKSKKRKKGTEGEEDEKPAKTPKTTQKLKLNAPKTPTAESSSKKKTQAKSKSSSKKKAAAPATFSDDEMDDTPAVEEKPLSPAEILERKEKEIRYFRHKLQKGFLSRDDTPNDEEIGNMSNYLTKLEGHADLESSIIRSTKIHKVLKAMLRLNSIPKDEEYNFKKRSMDLLTKWNKVLAEDATGGADKDDDKPEKTEDKSPVKEEPEDKADTNGVTTDTEPKASGALDEAGKDKSSTKIGTTVEGEKEAEEAAEPATNGETDAPDVENAPAAEYKPPSDAAETDEATA